MSKNSLAGWLGLGATFGAAMIVAVVALCFAPAKAVAFPAPASDTPPPGYIPPNNPNVPPIYPIMPG